MGHNQKYKLSSLAVLAYFTFGIINSYADNIQITFSVERHDLDGRQGWNGVIIQPNHTDIICDDVTGEDGVARCWVTCSKDDPRRKKYSVSVQKHIDFDRHPSKISVIDERCNVQISPTKVTLVHFRVQLAEAQWKLNSLISTNQFLAKVASTGDSDSKVVYRSIQEVLAGENAEISAVSEFRKISANLSAIHLRAGNKKEASKYSKYATTVAVALLWDVSHETNPELDSVLKDPGTLSTYYNTINGISKNPSKIWTDSNQVSEETKSFTESGISALTGSGLTNDSFRTIEQIWKANKKSQDGPLN